MKFDVGSALFRLHARQATAGRARRIAANIAKLPELVQAPAKLGTA